ncbi:hypothetical protein BHM03_00006960 [Ensete ventricosum]|nr:hypothetical protein BHM03_00006960 [Ensete ventricosum]
MDVPEGLISRLCHLVAFLPFFLLLLLLAVVKGWIFSPLPSFSLLYLDVYLCSPFYSAAFIAPIVFVTVLVGNAALILGLYPLHTVWTCYCIARSKFILFLPVKNLTRGDIISFLVEIWRGRTKRFGSLLRVLILLLMPIPILLWPLSALIGTILAGLGFAIALPLMATFEAVREDVPNKLSECFTENSTTSGILYVIAVISMFDEFTNDFLYLREGSCFPRYLFDHVCVYIASAKPTSSANIIAHHIWDNFFMACESVGKELIRAGAIRISDLEQWQNSKNKTINIGIPSYVFLQCFVRSIKSGSVGFVMRMNASLDLP